MDSLNKIINDLNEIASANNYKGPSIDALVFLLANSIYTNNLNAVTTVLEASSTRCKRVNSAIQHAKDIGYSVNRGSNQRIIIKDLEAVRTERITQYTQAVKVGGVYLYYANDYDLVSGNKYEIEFVVGESMLEEYLSGNAVDLLKLHSNTSDWAGEVLFSKKNTEGLFDPIPTTELRHLALARFSDESDVNYWMVTNVDYSVEIYGFSKLNQDTNTESKWVSFNTPDEYRLKGIKYTEKVIKSTDIKTIPGFKAGGNNTYSIQLIAPVVRESGITDIYLNATKAANSSFVIRTTDDLEQSTLALCPALQTCKLITKGAGGTIHYLNQSTNTVESKVLDTNSIITYHLKKGAVKTEPLTQGQIETLRNGISNAYYVNYDYIYYPAVPRAVEFNANLYYNKSIGSSFVDQFISKYEYRIGVKYQPELILSELVSEFDEIAYMELIAPLPSDNNEGEEPESEWKNYEFAKITININYQAALN